MLRSISGYCSTIQAELNETIFFYHNKGAAFNETHSFSH